MNSVELLYMVIFIVSLLIYLFTCNKKPSQSRDTQTLYIPPVIKEQPVIKDMKIQQPKVIPPSTITINGPLEWFIVERALSNISNAEQLIVNELVRYNVSWYREVAFHSLKTEKGYYRYDFLIETPESQVGFFIVEYDGALSHMTPEQAAKDIIKTNYCHKHNIPLIRFDSRHYYKLPYEISSLMNMFHIKKK